MTQFHVARLEELDANTRRIVHTAGGQEIAIIRVGTDVYAYENRCLHMGGPIGEGKVFRRVDARLDKDKRLVCEALSPDELQLVCPWHSWAYDVRTGEFAGDPTLRLNRFQTRVEEGDVYLIIDE